MLINYVDQSQCTNHCTMPAPLAASVKVVVIVVFDDYVLLCYVRMFLPELYALPHQNFFKFHAPTSGLAHALFLYLRPLSGTHCLTAFVSVNLCQLSGNTLKHFIFNRHSMAPPSDPPPSASDSVVDFGTL